MTSLLFVQHVVLAFQNLTPAPYAEIHALAAALKAVFGKRCWLLPAQHLAPHSGCSREPLHLPVPQPVLPTVLLCVWFQAREALLKASQHCRNQDAVVRMMSQEKQETVLRHKQNAYAGRIRPAIARIQYPCPKPEALSGTASAWGKLFSPLFLCSWAKLCCRETCSLPSSSFFSTSCPNAEMWLPAAGSPAGA